MRKKERYIYILNYYMWNGKLIGTDWNPIGYFSSEEMAIAEIHNEVARYSDQKLDKGLGWWWTLTNGNDYHYYEIFRVTLDKTAYNNTVKERIKLY